MTGEGTFEDLATLPNAPHITTIKKRASTEDWSGQRRAYRHQVTTKATAAASTTEAEISARHIKIAQALQAKALRALQDVDVSKLPPSEIRQFLATATDIERKAAGMDQQVTLRGVGDVTKLSDEELAALAGRLGLT